MSDRKPILCLDFDGVLHSYTSGWKGADIIPDPPVEGAMAFLNKAIVSFDVQIFSSRSNQEGGIDAMAFWLDGHWEEWAADQTMESPTEILEFVKFPLDKPPALVTLDDRAVTFTGIWPEIEALLAFQPWNKR